MWRNLALIFVVAALCASACSKTPTTDMGGDTEVDMAPDVAPDLGPEVAPFRVATLNVGRLFDTVCDSGRCAAADFEGLPSQAEFEFKIQQLTTAIRELDVDAILLQEVENQACVDALMGELGDVFSVGIIGETGGAGSVDVVVLSKGTHTETRLHKDDTELLRPDGSSTSFARELLEVHVDRDGDHVVLITGHFKSQRNDDAGRRLAEAEAARDIALATATEFPDSLVVLGGDINSAPGEPAYDAMADSDLLSTAETIDEDDRWTYSYFNEKQAIDHLFLAPNDGGRFQGDAEVIRDQLGALGGSDHAALTADFGVVR